MSSQSFLWKWLDCIVSWLFLVLAWVTQDLLSAFWGCIILHWAVVRLLLGQQCWCLHPSSKGCWDEAGYSLAHPLLSQLFTFIESAFCPANWASSASMTHHRPKWVLYYSGSWHQLVKSQKSKWRQQEHKKNTYGDFSRSSFPMWQKVEVIMPERATGMCDSFVIWNAPGSCLSVDKAFKKFIIQAGQTAYWVKDLALQAWGSEFKSSEPM